MKFLNIIWIIAATALLSCQAEKKEEASSDQSKLGEVSFSASGDEEALPYFEKGLLLLHSFEYDDAREEFRKARRIDPDFAMAYWGEAMTYNKPLWRIQKPEAASELLDSLGPTPEERAARAETELEKDLLAAVEVLYGEGTKTERDDAYAQKMSELYEKYPGQSEIAAFYALSLLGSVEVGRDEEVYGQSARIAQSILEENPNHPGALHYLIHSYDDPGHARLAKNAADRYSQVAPDAAHALHMPSHIYVALGMWDEVVNSNIDAYQASVDRMKRKGLGTDQRDYHSYYWLQYGYHQKGAHEKAEQMVKDMVKFTAEDPTERARDYLIDMKGTWLTETGNWDSDIREIEVDMEDLNIVDKAKYRFIDARAALEDEDESRIENEIATLEEEIYQAEQLVTDQGVALCGSGGFNQNLPNRQDVAEARIHLEQMKALQAMLHGNHQQAESHLLEAIAINDRISYSYGPPVITIPAHEMYARFLLEKGDYEKALKYAELALERGPGRRMAVRLKAEAKAEAKGKWE